jgi:hypothetical protein
MLKRRLNPVSSGFMFRRPSKLFRPSRGAKLMLSSSTAILTALLDFSGYMGRSSTPGDIG